MKLFKDKIVEALFEKTKQDFKYLSELVEVPADKKRGDFSLPCFQLAKELKDSPQNLAQSISEGLVIEGIEKIEVVGSYINFFINKNDLTKDILEDILQQGEAYGSSLLGEGKTIVIDFSSVNIAKPFHIGHLKSTAIGNSLYKIFSFLGYRCLGINHLGDWGTQFGKLIVAYKKWGDGRNDYSIKDLVDLYVKFHQEAEKNKDLDDEAREAFKRLENGEEEYLSLWKMFRDISLTEFKRVYDLLKINFDSWDGESFYNDKIQEVLSLLEEKKMLQESQGAHIIDLEKFNMPPAIIKRSDGASLYLTRDIAAALYRKREYDFYKMLYIVGNPQQLHFKQLFKVLELMEYPWANDLVHVNFGSVSLEEGAMSTRKGIVVYLEDVLNETIKKVKEILAERDLSSSEKDALAKDVGIGAVIFSSLFVGRQSDSTFLWDKVLNFEGDSAPYVQYTFARINSLLLKASPIDDVTLDYSLLNHEAEISLIKLLAEFPDIVLEASEKYDPSIIARYVVELSKQFNKFYHNCPVINPEQRNLEFLRLTLSKASGLVIKNSLSLLGIACPEKM